MRAELAQAGLLAPEQPRELCLPLAQHFLAVRAEQAEASALDRVLQAEDELAAIGMVTMPRNGPTPGMALYHTPARPPTPMAALKGNSPPTSALMIALVRTLSNGTP